jgi:hypothetical protein
MNSTDRADCGRFLITADRFDFAPDGLSFKVISADKIMTARAGQAADALAGVHFHPKRHATL